MRIKSWMIPAKAPNSTWANVEEVFKDKRKYPRGYRNVNSRKDARREIKQDKIRFRRVHKNLLNDLYMYLRPGSKINTCGMGDTRVEKVIVELEPNGEIFGLEIPSIGNPKYMASCSWGSCVSLGWAEPILNDNGDPIGYNLITEAGPKTYYYDSNKGE